MERSNYRECLLLYWTVGCFRNDVLLTTGHFWAHGSKVPTFGPEDFFARLSQSRVGEMHYQYHDALSSVVIFSRNMSKRILVMSYGQNIGYLTALDV